MGRTVLTKVEAFGGFDLANLPDPQVEVTTGYAHTALGIAMQTIRNLLSKHKALFDVLEEPYHHNGERILTPRDYQTLKAMCKRRQKPIGWRGLSREK